MKGRLFLGGSAVVAAFVLVLMMVGYTPVDTTEHCVETRYGKVVDDAMETGFNLTLLTEATCFPLTDQNFPVGGGIETIEAQTGDPVTVQVDVSIVYAYDPANVTEVFLAKRSEMAVQAEILNGTREGLRNALAGWRVSDIFSSRRQNLSDSVRVHIQRKVGDRALIKQAFVRDIKIPAEIEMQRVEAAKQAQILDQARQQFVIDSVRAAAIVMTARANAEAKKLQAESYSQNARMIELDIAKEWSSAISNACKQVQTCVLGGSIMDAYSRR